MPSRSSKLRASIFALAIASGTHACGSDSAATQRDEVDSLARSADDDSTDGGVDAMPGSSDSEVVLPTGEDVSAVVANELSSLAYDASGVLWAVSGCHGAHAITPDGIVRYSWIDSELPRGANYVAADSLGRRWFYSWSAVAVLDGAEWRQVHSGDHEGLSVAPDGTAWILGLESAIALDLGYSKREVPLPDRALSLAAESAEAVWVSTVSGIYRWNGSVWMGPVGDLGALAYDAKANSAWALGDPGGRVQVEGDRLVLEPTRGFPSARFVGFDGDARMVFAGDDIIAWYEDAARVDQTAAAIGQNPVAAIAPDDGVVFAAPDARVVRWTNGDSERDVVRIAAFDETTAFPWRATDYAELRAEPSMDVSAEQLQHPDASLIGKKLRIVGYLESAFEWSGINVEGTSLPYWTTAAPEFGQVASDLDLAWSVSVDGPAEPEAPRPWEIFAYLETGTCFGHLGGWLAQLYIVEAYPLEDSTQAARISERLDEASMGAE